MIGLNPEWDHWFDEAFTDLVTGDDDLVQAEFAELIEATWRPSPARPPASPPTPRSIGEREAGSAAD